MGLAQLWDYWRAWQRPARPPKPSPTRAPSILSPGPSQRHCRDYRVSTVQTGKRRLTECLEFIPYTTKNTPEPPLALALSREQQFLPTPECSRMFQKASFKVRIYPATPEG